MLGSHFSQNIATVDGGAISSAAALTVTNSTFEHNQAVGAAFGGAIAAGDADVMITASSFRIMKPKEMVVGWMQILQISLSSPIHLRIIPPVARGAGRIWVARMRG